MKKALILFFLVFSAIAFGQEDAWVYLNAKPNSENYFANPLLMLSQRALDRRNLQNIPLDVKDIPISEDFVAQIGSVSGITVKAKSKWLNAVHVRGSVTDISALSGLAFVSQVVFADKNLNPIVSGKSSVQQKNAESNKANDSQVNYNYGDSENQIEMLNGNVLHQQDYTGTGKIIAVLDAGFPNVNSTQPFTSLFANNQILGGYNFVSRNTDIYSLNNHGTLVLSTMGGYVENQLVGTAPNASYYLFVTEDATSENPVEESLWVEAAEAADSLGVDIINTSLGYFGYDDPDYSYTYEDMNGATSFIARGADIAVNRGMIVVVSAGNSGSSANPHISTPGDAVKVLTVGAVDAVSGYAPFSSIGPSYDGRVKPDVMAQGVNSVVTTTEGSVSTANGTSFSAPIIAGMVACLWQALPNKSNQQIVQLIKQSAHLYNTPNAQFGYGIPDFNQALLSGLGVEDIEKTAYTIFPNPATDYFYIDFPINIKSNEILVYNSLGQLMVRNSFKTGDRVSTQNLSPGIYFYQILSSQKTQTGKLIIK